MSSAAVDFCLIRHGETDWNREARMQGHADVGLNAQGRAQAEQVAQALQNEVFDVLYASDLSRAADTAAAIARLRQPALAVQHTPLLRERDYGRFQGMTLAEVEAIEPDAAQRWRSREAGFAPDGGETLLQFAARMDAWLQDCVQRHAGQRVAVVTHGGVLDIVWRLVHGVAVDVPRAWPLPNTGVSRLRWQAGQWQLLDWGNTQHLSEPAVVRDETIA